MTLARRAFEAYVLAHGAYYDEQHVYERWEELPDRLRLIWQDVADAVLRASKETT